MTHYLIAFSLYTLAMIGIFFIAFVVYKKTVNLSSGSSKSILKVEDALRLNQRKTIYIIRCGIKRFLIASDTDKTTFLAELEPLTKTNRQEDEFHSNQKSQIEKYLKEVQNIDNNENLDNKKLENLSLELQKTLSEEEAYDEYDNSVEKNHKSTVMKNILKELHSSAFKGGKY